MAASCFVPALTRSRCATSSYTPAAVHVQAHQRPLWPINVTAANSVFSGIQHVCAGVPPARVCAVCTATTQWGCVPVLDKWQLWAHALQVVDIASGAVLRTLPGDSEPVTALAVSPDGESVFTASRSLTCKRWSLATGECLRAWRVRPAGRREVERSPGHLAQERQGLRALGYVTNLVACEGAAKPFASSAHVARHLQGPSPSTAYALRAKPRCFQSRPQAHIETNF
jgi:hypothetical protein